MSGDTRVCYSVYYEAEAKVYAEAATRSRWLFTLGPEQRRLALDEVQSGKVPKPLVDMEDLSITDGPSKQGAVRILRPQHAQTQLPVFVYVHGSGWGIWHYADT